MEASKSGYKILLFVALQLFIKMTKTYSVAQNAHFEKLWNVCIHRFRSKSVVSSRSVILDTSGYCCIKCRSNIWTKVAIEF